MWKDAEHGIKDHANSSLSPKYSVLPITNTPHNNYENILTELASIDGN